MYKMPWYFILAYIAIGALLLWAFDRFNIIKSKTLRYLIVIFVYSFAFEALYDLIKG